MSVSMHPTLQKRFASFTDLTPIEFHALWGHSDAQFLEGRMLHSLILNQPQYWLSIPDRTLAGLWTFGPKIHGRVQETTLLTMIDDVTGELAYHVYLATQTDNKYIGFTVNLRMDKHTNVGAVAREFYFEARAVDVEGRKVGVECRVFDARTSAVLMTARAMFVFMSFAQISKRSANTQSVPYEMQPQISSSCDIDTDLRGLDRVMNFLPPNTVTHSNGSLNTHTRTLVVGLDFGPNISGPPIYVHGGILATVLYNASELLFAKSLGVEDDLINASVRDVNYYKGVPLECRNVTIDASVETQDEKQVVVFAKLMQGPHVFTTLKTTFTLQSSTSSKL